MKCRGRISVWNSPCLPSCHLHPMSLIPSGSCVFPYSPSHRFITPAFLLVVMKPVTQGGNFSPPSPHALSSLPLKVIVCQVLLMPSPLSLPELLPLSNLLSLGLWRPKCLLSSPHQSGYFFSTRAVISPPAGTCLRCPPGGCRLSSNQGPSEGWHPFNYKSMLSGTHPSGRQPHWPVCCSPDGPHPPCLTLCCF